MLADLGTDLDAVDTRLVVGGDLAGFEGYDAALAGLPPGPAGWTTAVHRLGGNVVVMERFAASAISNDCVI